MLSVTDSAAGDYSKNSPMYVWHTNQIFDLLNEFILFRFIFWQVWVTIVLISALVTPSVQMLKAYPLVVALKQQVVARFAGSKGKDGKAADDNGQDDIRQETLDQCNDVQGRLVGMSMVVLAGTAFGPAVPALLILVPLTLAANYCASVWLQNEPSRIRLSFGQVVAANVMVQQPAAIIASIGTPLSWLVCGFLMWDLSFDILPIVLYAVLSVLPLCVYGYANTRQKPSHDQHVDDIVWFNRYPELGGAINSITFRIRG